MLLNLCFFSLLICLLLQGGLSQEPVRVEDYYSLFPRRQRGTGKISLDDRSELM